MLTPSTMRSSWRSLVRAGSGQAPSQGRAAAGPDYGPVPWGCGVGSGSWRQLLASPPERVRPTGVGSGASETLREELYMGLARSREAVSAGVACIALVAAGQSAAANTHCRTFVVRGTP